MPTHTAADTATDATADRLRRINAFLAGFARRQAGRTAEVPGGFAVYNDEYPQSYSDNQLVIDGNGADLDPAVLPELADTAFADRTFRHITVLDGDFGFRCAEPLLRAGYEHSAHLLMVHTGAVPDDGGAEEVDLEEFRQPLTRRIAGFWPHLDEAVLRSLVDRREVRRRGAEVVRFLGSRTANGQVAAWADLYLEPSTGIAQFEDLLTAEDQLRRGHAAAVLTTALHRATAAGCDLRFLIAEAEDWPQQWYQRLGFTAIGRSHCFQRV